MIVAALLAIAVVASRNGLSAMIFRGPKIDFLGRTFRHDCPRRHAHDQQLPDVAITFLGDIAQSFFPAAGIAEQVEVICGQGMPRIDAIKQVQITEQTFYRWRKQYGGMGTDQLKELRRLQKENDRLRRTVSDLTSVTLMLSEAAWGNY